MDIVEWLRGLGLEKYAPAFAENAINWDVLPMKSNLWWFPYSEKRRQDFKVLMKVLHKWGLKKWI